jgi:predicted kinase
MITPKPRLIIISGPPGAGKSTLARPLARRLGLPLFEKDTIKEGLADALGEHAAGLSRPLGRAAIKQIFDIAEELLRTGNGLVIEGAFHRGLAEIDLAPLLTLADATLIHVRADDALLLARFERRITSPDRHPIHNDGNRLGELRQFLAEGFADPLDLDIRRIVIDTTYGPIDAEEVAFMVQENDDE